MHKTKLEEEKTLLKSELKALGVFDTETNDWEATPEEQTSGPVADENDLADRFEDYEDRNAKVAVLEGRLKAVDAALLRTEDGSYGTCRVGGEPIEADRLEANPAADTCIAHKDL